MIHIEKQAKNHIGIENDILIDASGSLYQKKYGKYSFIFSLKPKDPLTPKDGIDGKSPEVNYELISQLITDNFTKILEQLNIETNLSKELIETNLSNLLFNISNQQVSNQNKISSLSTSIDTKIKRSTELLSDLVNTTLNDTKIALIEDKEQLINEYQVKLDSIIDEKFTELNVFQDNLQTIILNTDNNIKLSSKELDKILKSEVKSGIDSIKKAKTELLSDIKSNIKLNNDNLKQIEAQFTNNLKTFKSNIELEIKNKELKLAEIPPSTKIYRVPNADRTLGVDGDLLIDKNGVLYVKKNDVWSNPLSLRGADGVSVRGPVGATGVFDITTSSTITDVGTITGGTWNSDILYKIINVTGTTYTATTTDHVINVKTGSTITIPSAINNEGKSYIIKNSSNGIVNIIGSSTFDDSTTLLLNIPYQSYTIISDNTQWIII